MGDLILMTPSTSSGRRAPPVGGTADILFFTGVRYYRMDETYETPVQRRRRRSKAKQASEKLELSYHA